MHFQNAQLAFDFAVSFIAPSGLGCEVGSEASLALCGHCLDVSTITLSLVLPVACVLRCCLVFKALTPRLVAQPMEEFIKSMGGPRLLALVPAEVNSLLWSSLLRS